MKKLLLLTFALVIILSLVSCGGNSGGGGSSGNQSASGGSASSGGGGQNGSITLESMKKAAADAGYEVEDGYLNPSDSVGSFSVVYPEEFSDAHIPVIEFKDKASAEAFAEKEHEAGYNYCVINGNVLDMGTTDEVVVEYDDEQVFFENLLNGRPVEKRPE